MPHRHAKINYSKKTQYATEPVHSPPLDDSVIKRAQAIIGVLLFYARSVNNKILVALIEIDTQQAAVTKRTNEAISQLLYYFPTYPNDGIVYHSSNMILDDHADAAYLNLIKYCSRADAHIMLSKNYPVPHHNGPILTIAQIFKFVVSSAAED